MSLMSSLFGSNELPGYIKDYNQAAAQYGESQMAQNQANWDAAQQASQLGASSDIGYNTASGAYLNANPYIDQVAQSTTQGIMDAYNRSVIPQTLSSYASSGRYGSGLMTDAMTNTQSQLNTDIADAMSNLYYGNYNQERAYQESAQNRLGQQYDPLTRNATYSGIINTGQYAPQYYQESDPGLVGNVGSLVGLGSSLMGFF